MAGVGGAAELGKGLSIGISVGESQVCSPCDSWLAGVSGFGVSESSPANMASMGSNMAFLLMKTSIWWCHWTGGNCAQ